MPEQYTYQVGKINFIVTPVYKDKRSGETMKDILLKLMLADLESGDILNIGGTAACSARKEVMRHGCLTKRDDCLFRKAPQSG